MEVTTEYLQRFMYEIDSMLMEHGTRTATNRMLAFGEITDQSDVPRVYNYLAESANPSAEWGKFKVDIGRNFNAGLAWVGLRRQLLAQHVSPLRDSNYFSFTYALNESAGPPVRIAATRSIRFLGKPMSGPTTPPPSAEEIAAVGRLITSGVTYASMA